MKLKSSLVNNFLHATIVVVMCLLLTSCATNKKPQRTAEEQRAYEAEWQKKRAEMYEKSVIAEKENARIAELRKDAGKRNAVKIQKLGFSTSFLNTIIRTNFIGIWSEFMPTQQFLGIMLDNPKIASIESFSHNGNPGVFIKQNGMPGVGIIYRIEGKEAYPYALQTNGEFILIQISDQFGVATLMDSFTR
jgi:hypothetical protein